MAVTFARNGATMASSDGFQADYQSVSSSDTFVVTFSDGVRIAIVSYNDPDGFLDLVVGIPTPVGTIDTVNIDFSQTGNGASFAVYDYGFGSLGSPLYAYNGGSNNAATMRITYNTSSRQLQLSTSGNTSFDGSYAGNINNDGTFSSFTGSTVLISTICYLRGTRILTATGEVPVEALQPGDLVATRFGGLRPVRWVGTQNFIGLNATGMLAPVCIRAGALGPAQPRHDLWVSPGHAVLVQGQLVCAYLLLNGTTIVQPPHTGAIAYFHIDLGTHDCVLAEGAWAETYYEHLNRDDFDNAGSFRAGFPDHAPTIQPTCLPYVNQPDDPALPAIRAALAAPQRVHLVADGTPLLPQADDIAGWRFHLPAGVRSLRLRSPVASPHAMNGLPDHRRLGVRLRAAILSHEGGETALDLASPALSDGWHALEPDADGPWRWTDGDAEIPLALLGALRPPATLILDGYGMTLSGAPAASQRRALAG